jgi:hypothetical protein
VRDGDLAVGGVAAVDRAEQLRASSSSSTSSGVNGSGTGKCAVIGDERKRRKKSKEKIKSVGPTHWRGSRGPLEMEVWRGNLEGHAK